MAGVTISNWGSSQCLIRTFNPDKPSEAFYEKLYVIQPGGMNVAVDAVTPPNPLRPEKPVVKVKVNNEAAVLYRGGSHIDVGPKTDVLAKAAAEAETAFNEAYNRHLSVVGQWDMFRAEANAAVDAAAMALVHFEAIPAADSWAKREAERAFKVALKDAEEADATAVRYAGFAEEHRTKSDAAAARKAETAAAAAAAAEPLDAYQAY